MLKLICLLIAMSLHPPFGKCEAQPEHPCIQAVIEADNVLGTRRNEDCETKAIHLVIEDYSAGLRKLDYSACPEEFVKAFHAHINAWEQMVPLVKPFAEMRGEMHEIFNELKSSPSAEEIEEALDYIWDTWAAVEEYLG